MERADGTLCNKTVIPILTVRLHVCCKLEVLSVYNLETRFSILI